MKHRLFVLLQYLLPQHAISRCVGWLASSRAPAIRNPFIRMFAKHFDVNMQEAEREDLDDYMSFNDFFTRTLKADARPIDYTPNHLACPVDGSVSQIGSISRGNIFQAKGMSYTTEALLGGDTATAKEFEHGLFATLYLSPKDYHRIHMPCDGTLRSMTHVPGQLFSVNPATAAQVPGLFARNERVVTIFDTEFGPMAMVLVGAMIVASVETVWAGLVCPKGKAISHWQYQNQAPIVLRKGEEMGRFRLGSTVVMCMAKDTCQWQESLSAGVTTRMGQLLAIQN